jgi:acetyltransferase-like isoleucine patch superfamily enzyme
MSLAAGLRFYLDAKTRSWPHYVAGETLQGLIGWMPGLPGIALRAVTYRLFLKAASAPVIEDHVRICRPEDVELGRQVYIDHGAYLHGAQGGLRIGDACWLMTGCRLHVFNYRGLSSAGITLGRRVFVGEGTVMRGQGGITVGDHVLFGPNVMVLAVDHVFTDPTIPIMDQGITARGITIEDGCWLGAGATVLDGVTIGRGSCIGAGAVVTSSIPPYSLAVGVPARVVRDLLKNPMPPPDVPVHRGGLERL